MGMKTSPGTKDESADRFARPSEIAQLQAAQDATREFGRSK
jgi:hypothetical protein